ncbi:hypothetical protein HIM_12150 [Hirsutella minnesotensis 3608]|uniref:BAH domain-containing protein n=1 Tax=Hirsutella minnesotensis 3608 TaxID=1043627 RepID=A0A0F7ZQU3_9HYPO|nr:hypothetical protein HIM_12150 [Hirsutella minnesotensis 3608]
MFSRRRRSRRVKHRQYAECPFSVAYISPSPERTSSRFKTRKRGVEDKNDSVFTQVSPFTTIGRFETYRNLDVTYSVKPHGRWSSLTQYRSFVLNGARYRIGDFVCVANDKSARRREADNDDIRNENVRDPADFWIAKILEIKALDDKHVYARVYWMYSPDDLPAAVIDKQLESGCRISYRQQELIASNHKIDLTGIEVDIINVISIVMRTVVRHAERSDRVAPAELHWRQALDCRTWELSSPASTSEIDNMHSTKAPALDACSLGENLAFNSAARLSLETDNAANGNNISLRKADHGSEPPKLLVQARPLNPRDTARGDFSSESFGHRTHHDLNPRDLRSLWERGDLLSPTEKTLDTPAANATNVSTRSRSSRRSRVVSSRLAYYLPAFTQHHLLSRLQRILELACFEFGTRTMPDTLRRREWDCAESVELSRWVGEFSKRQKALFDTDGNRSLRSLFRSIANIRHYAVHRRRVNAEGIMRFLRDAEAFAILLGDVVRTKELRSLRLKMQNVLAELEVVEGLLRSHSTRTSPQIAASQEMRGSPKTAIGLEELRDMLQDLTEKIANNLTSLR